MFSVLILTRNEERNLPGCLATLAGCDDVVVLDSGSNDRTTALAQASGARVYQHPFTTFAGQRNHAHEAIAFAHDWVLHLDADERLTPELRDECAAVAQSSSSSMDGYFVAPKMIFQGRWVRYSTDFPAYQARYVHARRFRFIQVGHGQREAPEMRMGRLLSSYLHDFASEGQAALEARHRRYAEQEAAAFLAASSAERPLADLLARDPLRRRRALKALSHALPARGPLRFLYQYGWRLGFLDGRAGLAYCLFLARYEAWIANEIRRQRRLTPLT